MGAWLEQQGAGSGSRSRLGMKGTGLLQKGEEEEEGEEDADCLDPARQKTHRAPFRVGITTKRSGGTGGNGHGQTTMGVLPVSFPPQHRINQQAPQRRYC